MKIILGLLVMLAPLAAHGQLLKCVGKDGKVEYASSCPPGAKEMQTGIKNVPSSAPAAAPKSLAEREADFKKRQAEKGEAAKKEEEKSAEAEQKRQNCEQAQIYLKSVQGGNRISKIDPKTNERVYLEDADRPAEIAKAQRIIDQNCK
ncbi:MAG: DUF4124 domain-containing protein [Betaproteobacteria bacterium]|nr:DUF4124 domain-containing protein [Betaproteobacteria bacterium]